MEEKDLKWVHCIGCNKKAKGYIVPRDGTWGDYEQYSDPKHDFIGRRTCSHWFCSECAKADKVDHNFSGWYSGQCPVCRDWGYLYILVDPSKILKSFNPLIFKYPMITKTNKCPECGHSEAVFALSPLPPLFLRLIPRKVCCLRCGCIFRALR